MSPEYLTKLFINAVGDDDPELCEKVYTYMKALVRMNTSKDLDELAKAKEEMTSAAPYILERENIPRDIRPYFTDIETEYQLQLACIKFINGMDKCISKARDWS